MTNKNSFTHKILWFFAFLFALITVAVVVIPPMMVLNSLKPKIEEIVLSKTGIPAKIHGDVNFSLIGKVTVVAHDVSVPNGVIDNIKFKIPFFDIFNLKNAKISDDILVNGASLDIQKITPIQINNKVIINDSEIKFLNKTYTIINADISKSKVDAIVRTDQHKYEIKYSHNDFIIKNKNNDLVLTGKLLQNGGAIGKISIKAQDVNKWFEFETPRINGRFFITADFAWNGGYGIKFDNISADGIHGSIEFKDDGYKIIKLSSNNAHYNMSFFLKNPEILRNASFDLNFNGEMSFMHLKINHLKVITTGTDKQVNIDTIVADEVLVHGGYIDENGAHNVRIAGPLSGLYTKCLFNGTPTDWSCTEYSHGNNITSVFSVKDDVIDADVYSTTIYADMKPFVVTIRKLASSGEVRFYYPDMVGTLHLKKDSYTVDYTRLDDRSLNQAKISLKFLPDFMKDEPGDFVWVNGVMIFTPNSKQWQLSKSTDFFILRGENFKRLTRKLDLQAFNDLPYVLSGIYKDGNISEFSVEIADHKLTGTLVGKSITLKTDVINADLFINPSFVQQFEELSFFTNHPLLLPFETNMNIALSANKFIYKGTEYNNFVYSLHKNNQTLSISDSIHGNLLASINKHNVKYDITLQLNKFVIDKKILPEYMPLNISDTTITAEAKLKTFGLVAHDIISNLHGTFDASFAGGKLYGLGFAEFYASAPQINILNGEYFIYKALTGGITPIKKMHIVGTYNDGDIETTKPLTLSMPYTDAYGTFEIKNDKMTTNLNLVLRGTAPEPEPINIIIYPDNNRKFSLSDIMIHFDPEYMKAFIESHDQF
jgi:hypothetical protein